MSLGDTDEDYREYGVPRTCGGEPAAFSIGALLPPAHPLCRCAVAYEEVAAPVAGAGAGMRQDFADDDDHISPELMDDFADYEQLSATEEELQAFRELNALAVETDNEHGMVFFGDSPTEAFTSGLHGIVKIPDDISRKMDGAPANSVTVFHSHTKNTPPSGDDLHQFLRQSVAKIGVVSYNGDVYVIKVGDGLRPTREEIDESVALARQLAYEIVSNDTKFVNWTYAERNYMAYKKRMVIIARDFGWTIEEGSIR